MIYYAIADLHGRYDLLEKAITAICNDADNLLVYKVITLGDYIDRGPDSKKIIECLIDYNTDTPEDFICLQGNHEVIMVETIRSPLYPDWWIGNGGDATLKSYGGNPLPCVGGYGYYNYDPHVVPQEHVEWIANLPLYYETDKQVFVHAGVSNDDPLEKQSKNTLQWMLYSKEGHGGWQGKHVVHGHHQFADGPHEWSGRTNLDTYAWRTGRLVVGVFDDTQGKALRYLEVLGDDYAKDNPS